MKNKMHEALLVARAEERRLFALWTGVLWQGGSIVELARVAYETSRADREFLEARAAPTAHVVGGNDGNSSTSSDIAFSAGTMAESMARKRYETRGRRREKTERYE